MFRWTAVSLVLVAGFSAALTLHPRAARADMRPKARNELKIATIAPDGSTWMRIMDQLDAAIRDKTANEVGLKFYPGGIQGDDTVVLRKIRSGQLQGGGFTGVGLGEIAPGLRVLEVPFLFRNQAEVDAVMAQMGPVFEKTLSDAGWELLGWSDVGFVYLFSKDPISSADDVKKLKMWLWEGDPLAETFLKTLGVSPVPLPITDVVTSLQTGLIDAVYTSPTGCIALQWFTHVSNMVDFPVTHAVGAVVVTKASFDKLSPESQETVKSLCQTYFAQLGLATSKENEQSVQVLKDKGVHLTSLSAAQQQGFTDIGQTVQQKLVGSLYTQDLLNQVRRVLDSSRAGGKTSK